ncbi:hypothetical protein EMPS_02345 [Entomortierella parvispora]|uniref:Uncharacterized protein n=1 Tax=Entomortierella parvispora TaxID=205924 RepID=A0A9P3H4J2_9FUNG|nr:hypothetical protein EMPS_02345 [Entomortierella parvispora]
MSKPEFSSPVVNQGPSPAYNQQQPYGQQPPQQQQQQPYIQQHHQYVQQQQYGQQQQPPVMVYRRNEALIAQYQREIAENEIGCSDIAWFICCGPFALICCLPKYNAQQRAQTNLNIELAKVQ